MSYYVSAFSILFQMSLHLGRIFKTQNIIKQNKQTKIPRKLTRKLDGCLYKQTNKAANKHQTHSYKTILQPFTVKEPALIQDPWSLLQYGVLLEHLEQRNCKTACNIHKKSTIVKQIAAVSTYSQVLEYSMGWGRVSLCLCMYE